ncbi:MAG: penicillin-binding transpeptidase domain-containing protein [Acidibacillus sp.]|nr:penicillin-binding transpeptidase domain-containing protein [Acidibacillus sp.]
MKKQRMSRLGILRVTLVGFLSIVLVRIGYVQASDHFLAGIEQNQWSSEEKIAPIRGTIYDANGDQLAFSMPAYDLDLYLPGIQQVGSVKIQQLSSELGQIVGAPTSVIEQALTRKDVVWLRLYPYFVHVSLAKKEQVVHVFHQMNIGNDINPYKTYERVYPDGDFASQVVGFVDQTGNGAGGIEREYNQYLAGQSGSVQFMQDDLGQPLPFDSVLTKPVQNGDRVYLTIDAAIQNYAQEALATIQKRFTPAHAAIIVADPNTGAILAMATLPTFDPNQYYAYPASTLDTNWAISDPFEPGSTFKIVTLTGALATHAINLNQTYMSGVDYVNGVPIRDWNLWGWGRITYRMAMIYSSNTGFIHIGQAEGVQTLYHYIHLYGMDQPTGIDLPGESNSILFDPNHLNPVDFATMTFGQGLAVTPIQQVAEVGAVANGGDLLTPYLVQKIVAPDGQVVYFRKPHIVRRVASSAIMNEITNVMIQDVNQDPGLMAYVPGYNVAGKTGTAQIPSPNGGYVPHKYNLSFIGFVPAHHPVLEIYVTVNEPLHAIQFGNDVASPAAQFVLEKSLRYLNIPPHGVAASSMQNQYQKTTYTVIPNLIGDSYGAATSALQTAGIREQWISAPGVVAYQWPQSGTDVPLSSRVILDAQGPQSTANGRVTVPDLHGLSMVDAVSICSELGLSLIPSGDGYAFSQSVPAGQSVPLGSEMNVTFVAYH